MFSFVSYRNLQVQIVFYTTTHILPTSAFLFSTLRSLKESSRLLIMSFIPSVFIVFLCLSMHACIARHFGSVKVGGRVKQKIDMEPPVQGIIRGSTVENIDGAVVNTHHESKIDSKIVRGSSGGDKPSSSSSIMVSLKATNTEGSTRRKRLSVVRFGSIDLNNSHKVHEDAEVIDYDPPHRTPPIHNRKM